jgi:hypothetical protein
VGSASRRELRPAKRVPDLFPGTDRGSEWGDPLVRRSDAGGFGSRATPLPARESDADAIGGTVRDADTDSGRDADADSGANACADPRANPGTDADAG